MIENFIWVKLGVILTLLIFFIYIGKSYKGVIVGALTYIVIPTPDDIFTIPFITAIDNLPIWITTILYYGIAWILLILAIIFL